MATTDGAQAWLESNLNLPFSTSQTQNEVRGVLSADDLKSLPWKNEADPYSARPASFPSQYQPALSSMTQLDDSKDRNDSQGDLLPSSLKHEAIRPNPIHMIPLYPGPALESQHLSLQQSNNGQQDTKPKSKAARKSERRRAERNELLYLRTLVYGRPSSDSVMTPFTPISFTPPPAVCKKGKAKSGKVPAASGLGKAAAGRGKAPKQPLPRILTRSATGANTTELVGNRLKARSSSPTPKEGFLGTNKKEEPEEGAIMVKSERNSPTAMAEYVELKHCPASRPGSASLTGHNEPHMPDPRTVEGLEREVYVAEPVDAPSSYSWRGDAAERQHPSEPYVRQSPPQLVYHEDPPTFSYNDMPTAGCFYEQSPHDEIFQATEHDRQGGYYSYMPLQQMSQPHDYGYVPLPRQYTYDTVSTAPGTQTYPEHESPLYYASTIRENQVPLIHGRSPQVVPYGVTLDY